MIVCSRVNSGSSDFQELIRALDNYLAVINGTANDFFTTFNKVDNINHVIVAYDGAIPVGCGAIKEYATDTMEVKRMFVPVEMRGKGIASAVLQELETWARELNYRRTILETSKQLTPAIQLYKKNGYNIISNYGQYEGVTSSVCFEKLLT